MKRKFMDGQNTCRKAFHCDSPLWELVFAFLSPNLKQFVQLSHVQKAWPLQKYVRLLMPSIDACNFSRIATWTNLQRLNVNLDFSCGDFSTLEKYLASMRHLKLVRIDLGSFRRRGAPAFEANMKLSNPSLVICYDCEW